MTYRNHKTFDSDKMLYGILIVTLVFTFLWEIQVYFFEFPLDNGALHILKEALIAFSLDEIGHEPSAILGILVLLKSTLLSIARVSFALPVGILIGLALSLFFGLNSATARLSYSISTIVRGTPLIALIPLFFLWLGDLPVLAVFFYIVFCVALFVTSHSLGSILNLDGAYIKWIYIVAHKNIFGKIRLMLPVMLERTSSNISQIAGFALAFGLGAELIVNQNGLGELLIKAYRLRDPDTARMTICALVYVVLGLVCISVTEKVLYKASDHINNP